MHPYSTLLSKKCLQIEIHDVNESMFSTIFEQKQETNCCCLIENVHHNEIFIADIHLHQKHERLKLVVYCDWVGTVLTAVFWARGFGSYQ